MYSIRLLLTQLTITTHFNLLYFLTSVEINHHFTLKLIIELISVRKKTFAIFAKVAFISSFFRWFSLLIVLTKRNCLKTLEILFLSRERAPIRADELNWYVLK